MRLKLITAATEAPVTLDELKVHPSLRAGDDDDAWLDQLVSAVALRYEELTQRILMSSTWELYLDGFPCHQTIDLPAPLASVTSVKYLDTAEALQTWAATNYIVDTVSEPVAHLKLAYGISWPLISYNGVNAVTIRFISGYTAANIPANLKTWLCAWVAAVYDGNSQLQEIAEGMMRTAGRWPI